MARMTRPRNEKTSPRVARIAARVMKLTKSNDLFAYCAKYPMDAERWLKTLAASCLTQAPPKRKRRPA